jgi:ribosomal protein S18 acetylase RimI-like enzyme
MEMDRKYDCVIRNGSMSDLELLIRLGIDTFNETFAHLNKPEDMESYLTAAFNADQIASEIHDPQSTFLIAESDGKAAGYAKLHRGTAPDCVTGPAPIELARLYVVGDMHGKGVAGALMTEMLARSANEGFKTIWLGVWEHNERAKAFYRKWNFRKVGSHIFVLGSDAQTDDLMERTI